MPIHVIVHSPHALLRQALESLLASLGFEPTRNGEAQVAVCDLTTVQPLEPAPPPLPALAVIRGGDLEAVKVLRMGYKGYLQVGSDHVALRGAVETLRLGKIWAERRVLVQLLEDHEPELTPREQEVRALLLQGLRNQEIARALNLSVNTVKAHTSHIYAKLHVRNRVELLRSTGAEHGRGTMAPMVLGD